MRIDCVCDIYPRVLRNLGVELQKCAIQLTAISRYCAMTCIYSEYLSVIRAQNFCEFAAEIDAELGLLELIALFVMDETVTPDPIRLRNVPNNSFELKKEWNMKY